MTKPGNITGRSAKLSGRSPPTRKANRDHTNRDHASRGINLDSLTPWVDPVAVTLGLLTNDLHQLWERQYEVRGRSYRGLTQDEFYSLTAYQLFRQFFVPRRDESKPVWDRDPVALLRYVNETRVKAGLRPDIPPHVLQGVPRG